MKSSSLIEQLMIGFLLSLFASFSIPALMLLFNAFDAFNLTVLMISIFYIGAILKNSQRVTGRIVIFSITVVVAGLLCFFVASSQFILAVSLFNILLVRVVYYQKHLSGTAFDVVLIYFGFFIASGVFASTASWFLGFWCFFFIQSFIVFSDELFISKKQRGIDFVPERDPIIEPEGKQKYNQKFNIAKRSANQAIQQLLNH
ncbi:MAG: hypothetical protein COA86_15680 [Kangiella sp.]|nr:MAG: hypothetical protein COA86_15680 [Kangiella sp.]